MANDNFNFTLLTNNNKGRPIRTKKQNPREQKPKFGEYIKRYFTLRDEFLWVNNRLLALIDHNQYLLNLPPGSVDPRAFTPREELQRLSDMSTRLLQEVLEYHRNSGF